MFSLGSKTYFGISLLALAFGLVYLAATNDMAGITLLLSASAVAAFLGVTGVAATGAGDRISALVGREDPLANRAPRASVAPVLLAGAGGSVVLGAGLGIVAFVAGALATVVAGFVWFIAAWREHPRYVPSTSARVSDRFSLPAALPLAVLALVAVIVVSISRILLAVSKNGATAIALAVALVILGCGVAAAIRPKLDRRLVAVLGVIALAAVATLGIVGIALGEREFHKHGSEHGEAEAGHSKGTGEATEAGHSDADGAATEAVTNAPAEAVPSDSAAPADVPADSAPVTTSAA